jgi:hypothetical protein
LTKEGRGCLFSPELLLHPGDEMQPVKALNLFNSSYPCMTWEGIAEPHAEDIGRTGGRATVIAARRTAMTVALVSS